MPKKIKIKIKDINKFEFELSEDGIEGDFFSINDINENNIEEIKNHVKYIYEKAEEDIQKEMRLEIINKFRLSKEYQSLLKDKEILNLKIENLNDSKEKDAKIMKNEITNDLKLKFEKEKRNLEDKINAFQKDKEIEILKLQSDFDRQLNQRENRNIKVIGEDFENWVQNEFDNYFGMDDYVSLVKTTIAIGNTKPDFQFKILNDDKSIIDSVTIEVKTESSTGKTKNSDHYDKLEKDRNNLKSEYSLLVSELEPNNKFLIKRVSKYKNMFVIRPAYLMHFLSLIKYISNEKKSICNIALNFKDKQDILNEFEDMKTDILGKSIKNIEMNCDKILKEVDRMNSSISKINEETNKILDVHINSTKNKIESFKINKILKMIENNK